MTTRTLMLAAALTLAGMPVQAADSAEAEIRALFDAHEQAMNAHDLDTLMTLYAPGENTVLMGTTSAERWVGAEQVADAYRHFFEDFDAGSIERDCPWTQAAVSGDVGWISANCIYSDKHKDETREFALNITAVVRRLDGAWRLGAMHFSNPTAPESD